MKFLERVFARVVDVYDGRNVRKAAAYMDRLKPDWWQHIDPLTLNLNSPTECICGQNGLNWSKTIGRFPNGIGFASSGRRYEPLWLEEIAQRMPASATANAEAVASEVQS